MLLRLLRDDRGSNAIEYGLIAAIISLAIVAGAGATSTGIGDLFDRIKDQARAVANGLAT
jgi:pilus assembly protein Flp/PilA